MASSLKNYKQLFQACNLYNSALEIADLFARILEASWKLVRRRMNFESTVAMIGEGSEIEGERKVPIDQNKQTSTIKHRRWPSQLKIHMSEDALHELDTCFLTR
jgi:hypothetical protein